MDLRYPMKVIYADYLRALAGIVILATPFFFAAGSPIFATILGLFLLLFISFGVRTYVRQKTIVRVGPDAVEIDGPFGRRLAWDDITRVDLRYYSTRRERSGKGSGDGWMQIKICDSKGCIKIDSSLDQFNDLAAKVAAVAFQNNAEMSDATVENFTTMDITVTFPEEAAK